MTVIAGGREPIPPAFFERLDSVVGRRGKGRLLDRTYLGHHFPGRAPDDPTVSNWLNAIEHEYELIAYLADDTLTDWTRKAIRQSDQVLIVVSGAPTGELNPVEAFALEMHPPARRRLICLHETRSGWVQGTADWLKHRDVAMHHHVAMEDDADFKSLHRFLTGRAVGYVGAGGGGFGPAHIGVFKAFAERGVHFDLLGGASVGAAVLGGFAMLLSPEEVDIGTGHDVFVTSRGFKRFTLPRYALLDHTPFDDALQRQYRGIEIEDAWRPYFAVATVLDGSAQGPYLSPPRPDLEGGAGLRFAAGGAAAGFHRRRPDAGGWRGGGQHPATLDEVAQDRAEPGRPFRRARRAAALRCGLRRHSGTLAVAPSHADAFGPAQAAANPKSDQRAAALPGDAPEPGTAAGQDRSTWCCRCHRSLARTSWISSTTLQCSRRRISGVAVRSIEMADKGDPALAAILATKD